MYSDDNNVNELLKRLLNEAGNLPVNKAYAFGPNHKTDITWDAPHITKLSRLKQSLPASLSN